MLSLVRRISRIFARPFESVRADYRAGRPCGSEGAACRKARRRQEEGELGASPRFSKIYLVLYFCFYEFDKQLCWISTVLNCWLETDWVESVSVCLICPSVSYA